MKIFVTKYVLTQGIWEREATGTPGQMMTVLNPGNLDYYFHKGEYALTKEDAIRQANDMRKKKIRSLQGQIIRLNSLNFEKFGEPPQ